MSDHFDHTQQAPPLVEQTPPTLRPSARTTAGALLVRFVLRPVWLWRVELAAVVLVGARVDAAGVPSRPRSARVVGRRAARGACDPQRPDTSGGESRADPGR